jgi:hypothetical protein
MKFKEIFKLTWVPVVFASLCCLTPIVLVLLGLSGVAFAASLSDTLYYDYGWALRIAGLLLLAGSLFFYFRRKGICTLDDVKRRRKQVINTILLVLVIAIVAYLIFLYVILGYVGGLLGIWGN